MKKTRESLGFIGFGQMAKAIASGLDQTDFTFTTAHPETAVQGKTEFPRARIQESNRALVREASLIFLAIKPQYYASVLEEILPDLREDHLLVSLAPGIRLASLRKRTGSKPFLLRSMPNLAVQIKQGLIALCPEEGTPPDRTENVRALFRTVGHEKIIPESLMDIFTALCGSGPAFAALFAEALVGASVREGLPRKDALELTSRLLQSTGKLLEQLSPSELQGKVSSPGGTTAEGLAALEEGALRSTLYNTLRRTREKAEELSSLFD